MPLPNKPGEPEFKLKMDPADRLNIKFRGNEESVVPLNLTNPLKERVCYKVKCTDNEIFRVRPPLGFIKPGDTAAVKVALKPKSGIDPQRHFLAIYYVSTNEQKSNPRTIWTADTKPEGVIRMQVIVEDLGAPIPDEEKKEAEGKGAKEEKGEKKEDKKN